MTKLNEYFENKLSAQEQLEVQMWLAENGYNPDTEAQLEELFDKLHVDDEAAAKAAFQQVASRLGITAEARNSTACRSRIAAWSQRIAAILIGDTDGRPVYLRQRAGRDGRGLCHRRCADDPGAGHQFLRDLRRPQTETKGRLSRHDGSHF